MTEIEAKIKEAGITLTASNKNLPEIISDAIDTVRAFGYETWISESVMGSKIKNIIKQLA